MLSESNFHNFNIALTTFLIILIITIIPIDRLSFLDPIGQALNDFELYDLAFSKFNEDALADTNIVIVNIGRNDRKKIANQLKIISGYNPTVIGVDIIFNELSDSSNDFILRDVIRETSSIVLASRIEDDETDAESIKLVESHPFFSENTQNGYVNLPEDNNSSFRTVRSFQPMIENHSSFGVKIASLYDSSIISTLSERDEEESTINFRGNYSKFYFIDEHQLFDTSIDFSFMEGKIVLLGFVNSNKEDLSFEDIFFTPMNERYVGKTFPDMNGVVIHANIISMLLRNNFIEEMNFFWEVLFSFLLVFINVIIIRQIQAKYGAWNDTITNIFLVLQSILYLFIILFVFNEYKYKISILSAQTGIFIITIAIDIYELYILRTVRQLKLRLRKQ